MYSIIQKLFEPKTNCSEAAKLLADLLDVKITGTTLKNSIEEHPDYPSLLSISDVLNNFGIANISANINMKRFSEVPTPFITSIKGKKAPVDFFAVVSEIKNGNVLFHNHENGKWETCAVEELYNRSSGVVLMAEVEEHAGEKNYKELAGAENRKMILFLAVSLCIPLILLFSGVLSLIQNGINALLPFTFSILTLLGAITGVLLILYELDQYTPVIQKICKPGNKINCGAVLQSKASKIAGISWSTIGFSYFTGQILLLLFSGITNPVSLFLVSLLNALAAPYILFSIYYQWRMVKQWCVLCLTVQILLFLQFLTALIGHWHTAIPLKEVLTASVLVSVAMAYLIPFVAVSLLVPAYHAAKSSKTNKLQLQRLKHNPQVFEALLTKQKGIFKSTEGLGIILGNSNATTRIIKVCNPYCWPCSESHKIVEDLLDNNPDLQVQIIFLSSNDANDPRKSIVRHLMAIAEKGDETLIKEALDNWYLKNNDKDYESFSREYPLNGELQKQFGKIQNMHDWCLETNIQFTPTFFVNGYQLPEIYNVTDLKYFLSV
jgi:uncharacterized membrane protein/protein-disulfide isomerase